jgi:hypothetical protein
MCASEKIIQKNKIRKTIGNSAASKLSTIARKKKWLAKRENRGEKPEQN